MRLILKDDNQKFFRELNGGDVYKTRDSGNVYMKLAMPCHSGGFNITAVELLNGYVAVQHEDTLVTIINAALIEDPD